MKNLWPSISTSRCSMNSVKTNGFVPRLAPKSFTKHGWLIWLMICISWIKSLVASNKRFVFAGSMFLISDQKCTETSTTNTRTLQHYLFVLVTHSVGITRTMYYSTCALASCPVNRYERAWHSSESPCIQSCNPNASA